MANSTQGLGGGGLSTPGSQLQIMICSLIADVQYNIQVSTSINEDFGNPTSLDVSTENGVGVPESRPKVVATSSETITLQLQPSVIIQESLSGYFIVVQHIQPNIPLNNRRRRSLPDPVIFLELPGYTTAFFN